MAQDYYVTAAPQPSRFSKKMLLIGGGLVVALIVGFMLLGGGGNSLSKQFQHLSLRLTTLENFLENPKVNTNLKDQTLVQVTAELKLSLTTSKNELTPLMIKAGLPPQYDQAIINNEADTTSATELETAALNAKFDRTYATLLKQKIISLRSLTAEIFKLTKNKELKVALINLDTNLNDAKKKLDKLNF